jgi:predicted DNA-binding WGR domain protein
MSSESIGLFLRAENPARNCRRSYSIAVDRDLFGFWCVSLAWGRIGRPGRGRTHAFYDRAGALVFARQQLRRRLKARKRIGVDYEVVRGDLDAFHTKWNLQSSLR